MIKNCLPQPSIRGHPYRNVGARGARRDERRLPSIEKRAHIPSRAQRDAGARTKELQVKIGFLGACAVMFGLAWFGTGEAAQDSQVNCNEVMAEDRCACNER